MPLIVKSMMCSSIKKKPCKIKRANTSIKELLMVQKLFHKQHNYCVCDSVIFDQSKLIYLFIHKKTRSHYLSPIDTLLYIHLNSKFQLTFLIIKHSDNNNNLNHKIINLILNLDVLKIRVTVLTIKIILSGVHPSCIFSIWC